MRFCFIGAGAVGGFYAALLARQGHDVTVIARGAHLDAIRTRGLRIVGPLGDYTAPVRAEAGTDAVGHVDAALLAVKTYDNDTAIPMLTPLVGPGTAVVTLQNGVDSAEQIAAAVGEAATLGGSTYIATAIEAPGVIRQTGTHRRVVLGEYFNPQPEPSARARRIADAMVAADIHAEAVPDARATMWEKFTYLAPFAAVTGAARLPIGPLWADPDSRDVFLQAVAEVSAVARASGITLPADHRDRVHEYAKKLPASTRSSLLIDLSQGRKIEVEALQGSVVRRGRALGVPTPIMAAYYAVLKPWAGGPVTSNT